MSARPRCAFLIDDHDAKFTAERFVGTLRRECLDWLLISGRPHLERVLGMFVDHDNGHRPHRALGLATPGPMRPALRPVTSTRTGSDVRRRDMLGGVIREYSLAA